MKSAMKRFVSEFAVVLFALLVLIAALVGETFVAPAFGAGGGSGTYLSDNFDLGDINGGYSTDFYRDSIGNESVYLSVCLGGNHKINSSSISFYPNYWYTYDDKGNFVFKTLNGYRVNAYISGEINVSPTLADVGYYSQTNQFNARGISISENTWVNTYKSHYGTYGSSNYELFSLGGSSISIEDFDVRSANGRYEEYTYGGGGSGLGCDTGLDAIAGGSNPFTYFNYNVTWYGDFVPGATPIGFVAPSVGATVSATSVPEPSTILLTLSGLIGLAFSAGPKLIRRFFFRC